jgi:uncharacterized OB-fold protein
MSESVRVVGMPIRLEYTVTAGRHYSRYLRALAEQRITGARCSKCAKVYVPPRGSCPTCGVPTDEEVPIGDRGTLTTFCIVNIPFANMPFDPPYIAAAVLLDGADIPIFHLVRGIPPDEVRMGQRLRAVWVPAEKLGPTVESIQWFEPSGEPDADYETYREHT